MIRSIALPAPKFEYLFRLTLVRGETVSIGQTPEGEQFLFPYPAGTFHGEKLNGTVLPCGGDWTTRRPDGSFEIDGKYILKTDDGAILSVVCKGIAQLSPKQLTSVKNGGILLSEDAYYRVRLFVEAGKKAYRWLNSLSVIALGSIDENGHICLDAYGLR